MALSEWRNAGSQNISSDKKFCCIAVMLGKWTLTHLVRLGPLSPIEQGVILVTEHNAELNAGFVVLLGSNHAPPLTEEDWQNILLRQENARTGYCHLPTSAGVCILAIGIPNDLTWAGWSGYDTWSVFGLDSNRKKKESGQWRGSHELCSSSHRTMAKTRPSERTGLSTGPRTRACFSSFFTCTPWKASLLVLPGDGMFQAQRVLTDMSTCCASGQCHDIKDEQVAHITAAKESVSHNWKDMTTFAHALSVTNLAKSMSVVSQQWNLSSAYSVEHVSCPSRGYLGGIALPVLLHSVPEQGAPNSCWFTSPQTACVNGI